MTKPRRPPPAFEPSVLVVKEKYGTFYFHCPDRETVHQFALTILTNRVKDGYWYPTKVDLFERAKALKVTEDTIQALPVGSEPRVALEVTASRIKTRLEEETRDNEFLEMVEKAIAEKDGKEAYNLLRWRSDARFEYERIDLEPYCTMESLA